MVVIDARVEARIAELAGRQHAIVGRGQLLALGATTDRVDGWVRVGWLRVVHPGVYSLAGPAGTPHAVATAAVMACGAGSRLTDVWALWLLGCAPPPRCAPTVVRPGTGRPGPAGVDLRRTRALPARDVTWERGIPVVRAARALLDAAETRSPAVLERLLHEALVRRRVTERALRELLERSPGRHGRRPLAALLDGGAGHRPTRNGGERRVLALIRDAGLVLPDATNVPVGGAERDFVWFELKLVVEFDGYEAHGPRTAFERDRAQDVPLVALGFTPLHWTWRMVDQRPTWLVGQLGLAQGRLLASAATDERSPERPVP